MEVHVIEGIAERSAISSLCLNTQVLAAIAPGWTPDCFPSKWANIVGGWAAKYYNEYKEAPGVQGITALYADWAAGSDSDTAGIVNKWLTTLDPDQSVNPEYARARCCRGLEATDSRIAARLPVDFREHRDGQG